jgi:hypothetical protein
VIGDDELCHRIRDGQRVVVSGFGGIGKTIFCKYLWRSIYKNPADKTPVYFELRNLNDLSTQSLETYIRVSLTHEAKAVPEDVFREMLLAGRFVFILDGFDEVPDKSRLEIQSQILKMASVYTNCCFLVSSRADDRFSSWLEFHTYTALDFDKAQSREVIQKVDFDKEIRKEFLSEILEKRYEDYKTLFSTPLLTLMMLMTYMQIRYIPDSRHIFYKYAFQTLYTLHDASKQGFQRKRYVEMSESDFINVFSLFCLVSYADLQHSFSKEEVLDYFENVKARARVDFHSERFLQECVESVNLIFKDGDQYTFIHRSFQEYFCAYAATHYFPDKVGEVIAQLPIRHADSVFNMMYNINPDVISRMYVTPYYEVHQVDLNAITKMTDVWSILQGMGAEIVLFLDRKGRGERFGYGISFNSAVHEFVSSIVTMFKVELPFDRKSERLSHINIVRLSRRLFPSVKAMDVDGTTEYYRLNVDIKSGIVDVFAGKSNGPSKLGSKLISDIDNDLKISDCFKELSQAVKAEVVFAKRKCDELSRRHKEIRKRGTGILSL